MVITGTGFQAGATVTFGGTAATALVVTPTSITGLTPAHAAGLVDVKVTNPDGGSATLTNGFHYVPPVYADTPLSQLHSPAIPTDTRPNTHLTATPLTPARVIPTPLAPFPLYIDPFSGTTLGGQAATLIGFNFIQGATVDFLTYDTSNPPVLLSTISVPTTIVNANTASCLTPAHAAVGLVDVRITNPDTQTGTIAGGYLYTLPDVILSSVSPAIGTTAGGDTLDIHGANIQSNCNVVLGGTAATVLSANANHITVETPAHSPGIVTIEVVNP